MRADAELEAVARALLEPARIPEVDMEPVAAGATDRCLGKLAQECDHGLLGVVSVDVEDRQTARAEDDAEIPALAPLTPFAGGEVRLHGLRPLPVAPLWRFPVARNKRPAEPRVGVCGLAYGSTRPLRRALTPRPSAACGLEAVQVLVLGRGCRERRLQCGRGAMAESPVIAAPAGGSEISGLAETSHGAFCEPEPRETRGHAEAARSCFAQASVKARRSESSCSSSGVRMPWRR